jgi:spore germination cell wall hydrolase CwlJ-like protein
MKSIVKLASLGLGVFLVSLTITEVSAIKLSTYEAQAIQIEQLEHPTISDIEAQLDCMALNVYREAAGEPFEGKVAVAQVTLNRVKNEDFPDNVCGVVYERNVFMQKVVCQFSWYCNSANRVRPRNSRAYNESYEVAKKVLLEGFELESVKDALYFHADYTSPNWSYVEVAKIGSHIFYKGNDNDSRTAL